MPVILEPLNYELWLASETDRRTLRNLLFPFDANKMTAHQISKEINSYKNDRNNLLKPLNFH